jgi:hypothetical protein
MLRSFISVMAPVNLTSIKTEFATSLKQQVAQIRWHVTSIHSYFSQRMTAPFRAAPTLLHVISIRRLDAMTIPASIKTIAAIAAE